MIQQLISSPPKFVFNLCDEGFYNQATLELHIPALLEMLNIPYTGSGPSCLAQCYNKSLVRAIANSLKIAVPEEIYLSAGSLKTVLPESFPVLIKPNFGDGSHGITQAAVIENASLLDDYLNRLSAPLSEAPLLIQEFLTGSEYSVGLIGNPGYLESLPLLEVDYSALPDNLPKILSYESKWVPKSPYWNKIGYREALLSDEMTHSLIESSKALFEYLDCRDYARFDFRSDSQGNIKLLEVNPNPGWCWDGKFNLMADWAGISYQALLERILHSAQKRYQLP